MLDASKSPIPTWRRYVMAGVLTIAILVAGWFVWSKDLHHASLPGTPAAATTPPGLPAGPATRQSASTATTIPGGIPVSSRNPFVH